MSRPPDTERNERHSLKTAALIAALFLVTMAVFGLMVTAGTFLAGS